MGITKIAGANGLIQFILNEKNYQNGSTSLYEMERKVAESFLGQETRLFAAFCQMKMILKLFPSSTFSVSMLREIKTVVLLYDYRLRKRLG